ncbi:MAG: hypothetical protein O2894_10470 [Planctomycetota bacterium]|nr:hypothetical protein [Planctomycetota bacterium]
MLGVGPQLSIRTLVVAAVLVLGAGAAQANGYATDESGGLYRILPDEDRVERMGTVQVTVGARNTTVMLTDLALSDLHGAVRHLILAPLQDRPAAP